MSDTVDVASSDTPAVVEPIPEPTSVESESESPTLPKAAQAVYSNDLIMSLVYRFDTDRQHLAQCLLVSREGYDTAANEFFFKTSAKAMSRLFDRGCSFERLIEISARVRVIDAPDEQHFPFGRYPNLAMLRLTTPSFDQRVVTIQELVHRDNGIIILEHGYCSGTEYRWGHEVSAENESAGEDVIGRDLLSVAFNWVEGDAFLGVDVAIDSFMDAIRVSLQAGEPDDRFAKLRHIAYPSDRAVFISTDMVDILDVCAALNTLEIGVLRLDDEYRANFNSFISNPPQLEVMSLGSVDLCDLDVLLNCRHVRLITPLDLEEDWLMGTYMAKPFDERPKISRHMESLTIELEPGSSSCYVIAQFILCVINERTVVKVIAAERNEEYENRNIVEQTKDRAREVYDTLSFLRRVRSFEKPFAPGYKHVASPGDNPSCENAPQGA